MNKDKKQHLINRLITFADDEIILAHRDAEWTGHAPILEEDIAFANLAQDEIGHAMLFYALVEELTGETGDQLVMFRGADAFRNVQLVELPKGDWAFTMLRQYLYDAYEYLLYTQLEESSYQPLADAAAKMRKEEMYHLRHSHIWTERLGLGSAKANRHMQAALNQLWPYAAQLFQPTKGDATLIADGIMPDMATLHEAWQQMVIPHLNAAALTLPESATMVTAPRSTHTPHLTALLADMQMVARNDPGAVW